MKIVKLTDDQWNLIYTTLLLLNADSNGKRNPELESAIQAVHDWEDETHMRTRIYDEIEYESDRADVEDCLEMDEDYLKEEYEVTWEEIEALIPKMAHRKRRYENRNWTSDDTIEAIETVISEYKKERETK